MLQYQVALTFIPNIGDVLAKKLVAYCGGVEEVFKKKKTELEKIPGIGKVLADAIIKNNALKRAEEEIKYIEKKKITPLFYLDNEYPFRLKQCMDAPVMIYYKGTANLNASRMVSIVGTRNASEYGKSCCEKLVAELAEHQITIVSGLAYGIDICAHKTAIQYNTPTVAVLAHGLDRLYPQAHLNTAKKMLENGGLLSDYPSGTNPDRENFPKRNRIVAGMADATVVIESKTEGGSMITAEIANSYNRDVFAFPGRVTDPYSEGCNTLIKTNKAALMQSATDLIKMMGWEKEKKKKEVEQKKLFIELSPDEERIVTILKEKETIAIDELCYASGLSMSKVAGTLLSLEFSGVVKSLPGKVYKIN